MVTARRYPAPPPRVLARGLAAPRLYWTLHVGGWVGFGLLQYLVTYLTMGVGLGFVVAAVVVPTLAGIVLTHLYRSAIRARAWVRMTLPALAPRLAAGGLLVAAGVFFAYDVALVALTDAGGFRSVAWHSNAVSFFYTSMPVFGWSLVYVAYAYAARARDAEVARWQAVAAARALELEALRAQLDPHFLFNALNGVRALVAEEPARAREAVTQLSELLRYALRSDVVVPLRDEVETVRSYLALEAVRFEERLRYTVDVAPDALDVPVPPMLVQTLVENGIKHGVARRPGGGTLAVEARREGAGLHVRVTNSAAPTAEASGEGGLGLRNARERLRLLYGDAPTLVLQSEPDHVVADLRLPARPPIPEGTA